VACLAAGPGAFADTGPLSGVTGALCNPPDLGRVTSLLHPVMNTVSSTLACEPAAPAKPTPPRASAPVVSKPNTRPAAQTQPSVARPASPLLPAEPQRAKVGSAAVVVPPRGGSDIVSVPVSVARAAKFPIVFAIGVLAGVAWMVVQVRRRARRANAVERMKTELLSNISHELRTPLTPVRGYAEILRTRNLPPEKVRKYAEAILGAAEQLESVVNILVSFAAMEGGRIDVRRDAVEVGPMLSDLTERWQSRAPAHVLSTRADGVPHALFDVRLMKLAVDQLIDNAVKFSPQGGLITVRAAVAGQELEISVDDQGVGIADGKLETIFESFRQGDGSSTRRFGGLGLGLSLVARVAAIHGGEVRVQTKPRVGSTFTLAIPLRAARDSRIVGGGPVEQKQPALGRR
jgi:signal transduction histidine kinase